MTKDEFIKEFHDRTLNIKNNNFIIIGKNASDLSTLLEPTSKVHYNSFSSSCDHGIDTAYNIKVNLLDTNIHDLFKYTLKYLYALNIILSLNNYDLRFNRRIDVYRFDSILAKYNKMIQFIFYNFDNLSFDEQKLLNELYFYGSEYYNVTSLANTDFVTYSVGDNLMLDSREDYNKLYYYKEKELNLYK